MRDLERVADYFTRYAAAAGSEIFRNTYQLAELGGRTGILVSTLHASGGVSARD